jgi:hypothetical protein
MFQEVIAVHTENLRNTEIQNEDLLIVEAGGT